MAPPEPFLVTEFEHPATPTARAVTAPTTSAEPTAPHRPPLTQPIKSPVPQSTGAQYTLESAGFQSVGSYEDGH